MSVGRKNLPILYANILRAILFTMKNVSEQPDHAPEAQTSTYTTGVESGSYLR